MIYKFERGGGDEAFQDAKSLKALRDLGDNFLLSKKNKLTAAWELRNVYPYNIGSIQLDNSQAKTMDMNVQFYYERYRFWTEQKFSTQGKGGRVTTTTPDNVFDADQS